MRSKVSSVEKLKKLAQQIINLDDRVVEVFVHSDVPQDPFKADEVYLVCHLLDPEITYDVDVFNDRGMLWSLEISEKLQSSIEEMGITQEIIIMPFNFQLYSQGEYGRYYLTLYLKEGYSPILETADKKRDS